MKIISMLKLFYLICVLFSSSSVFAYPEFIGYGYSTCLTCHVNGHGSGPLNDYGRALWSAEIASRAFYPKSMSDEDIANQSGFLGSAKIPTWFRPYAKYRGLNLRTNVGSGSRDTTKYYQMQLEGGLTLQADEAGKYAAVMSFSNVAAPDDYGAGTQGTKRMLASEYYLKAELLKSWWIYVGLMDKVYGLRTVDHTSYQRTYQGFNHQNNSVNGIAQSQGIVIHKLEDSWEFAGNYFMGHPNDSVAYKQRGFSFMGEYEVGEKKRLGFSGLSAKSDVLTKNLFALHYRQGLSSGSSLLAEYGIIQDAPAGTDNTSGSYNLIEGMALLTRGYNFRMGVERYNKSFKAEEPDNWKWSVGLVIFPIPRVEWRLELVNMRYFSSQQAADDTWIAEGQIHVSL